MTINLQNSAGTILPATAPQIAQIQTDLGIPSTADIQAVIDAQTQLGAFAVPVQQLIDQSTQNKVDKGSSVLNLNVTPLTSTLTASSFIDPTTGLTITAALQAIRQAILLIGSGATPPTITTDPTVAFPGGSGDVGETFTITPGTIAGGANTGTQYQVVIDGIPTGGLFAGPTGTLPASYFTGTRLFRVIQNVTWTGGANITRSSITYTLNAPPSIPVNLTPPSWSTGTPQVGTVYTLNHGTYTNSPTSYLRTVYSGWVSAANKGTALTVGDVATYTVQSSDAGATLVVGEIAANAAGAAAEVFSSAIVITATAGAPQWVDLNGNAVAGAILPAFTVATANSGDTLIVDLGLTVGNVNPSGYNYQILRDGSSAGMPGASGVSSISYPSTSTDDGHIISAIITSSNSGGTSRAVTLGPVLISGVSSGGGGGGGSGGVLSGSVNTLADNATGTAYNLTTLGPTDWAAYINGSIAAPDKKSGGPGRITATVASGTGASGAARHNIQFLSWTGGTPNATGNGDGDYHVTGVGGDFQIVITGIGTTQEAISVWFEVVSPTDTVQITASLSDGSASNYTYSGTPAYNVRLDLAVKAGTAGQTLTIHIVNSTGANILAYQGVAIG